MPIYQEKGVPLHIGVTRVEISPDEPAMKLSQAVTPDLISPTETGVYYYNKETVYCLSSQTGCPMECRFCSSTGPFLFPGKKNPQHFLRNLRASEIIIQAFNAREEAIKHGFPQKPMLFSMMGMGEPLLNYENVKYALALLGGTFPESRATISTICPNPAKVNQLAVDITQGFFPMPVKLHFSLHASNDQLRRQIMPKAAPISDTIAAMQDFMEQTGLQVKANYVLLNGINDRPENEDELVNLLRGTGIMLKVSDLNSADKAKAVPSEEADNFAERIEERGVPTCRFSSMGKGISGCGELTIFQAKNYNNRILI